MRVLDINFSSLCRLLMLTLRLHFDSHGDEEDKEGGLHHHVEK